MSRTYRKNSETTKRSKVGYIKHQMEYTYRHYSHEFYMTVGDKIAYEKAMEEYQEKYYQWEKSPIIRYVNSIIGVYYRRFKPEPRKPSAWDFKSRRCYKVEYDYEKEKEYYAKEYDNYSRDGTWSESTSKSNFKEAATIQMRTLNRRLARKIIKDDDSWEHKSYPDTYLSKSFYWDYL